jgi:von Willebrand factor type A domain-containing protein
MSGFRSSLHRSVSVAALAFTGLAAGCSFDKVSPKDFPWNTGNTDAGTTPGVDVQVTPGDDGGDKFESDASQTCVVTKPKTTNLPPDVLIVLDRSGSMNDKIDGIACTGGCGANSKWTQMTQALEAFIPTVQTKVNWGLKLFATPKQNSCTVGNGAEVKPATNNAVAIMTAIGATSAGSSTPTTAAVNGAAAYLTALDDGFPKFILLATDGIPTCGTSQCAPGVNTGGSPTACDDANAIAAVKAVHDTMGIPTFVVGIGTSTGGGDATLTSMAQAGGYPRAGSPSYYPVGSATELTQAFETITGMVQSCTFTIDPPIDPKLQTISGVNADGVPLDKTDFTVIGTTGVQLVGKACTDLTAGTLKNIEVQVMCSIG